MPDWMSDLEDQEVTIGGEDLVYSLGKPVNVYNQTMVVEIKAGFADIFTGLDTFFNRFFVDQKNITSPDLAG